MQHWQHQEEYVPSNAARFTDRRPCYGGILGTRKRKNLHVGAVVLVLCVYTSPSVRGADYTNLERWKEIGRSVCTHPTPNLTSFYPDGRIYRSSFFLFADLGILVLESV